MAADASGDAADEPVWYSGSIAWVLAQIPGVRLSAASLRAVLFDVDFPVRLDPLERQGLRILQVSDEYRIHYSRRATLKRVLRGEIRKRASALAVVDEEVEKDLFAEDEKSVASAASLIASAVDQIARSDAEQKISQLEQERERLQKKLQG